MTAVRKRKAGNGIVKDKTRKREQGDKPSAVCFAGFFAEDFIEECRRKVYT